MKKKLRVLGILIGVLVGMFAFVFVLGLFSLGYYKFFAPKEENIRREVFEQTQSYVHGKIQDLAKYQNEYNDADTDEKEVIRQLIIVRFAEFDETKIKPITLRSFLISMRGY